MKNPPLTLEQRAQLAHEVFEALYARLDTWRDDHIGSDLAYLLGAILDAKAEVSFVEWSPENSDCAPILVWFRELFPATHPVWQFIQT